jgi:hypothetical protein
VNGAIVALPNIVVLTLGVLLALISAGLAANSVYGAYRRRVAERHFLRLLTQRLEETFLAEDEEFLELAEKQVLPPEEFGYQVRDSINKTLFGLDRRNTVHIIRALEQPSARGRDNYLRKVVAEAARRILRESGSETGAHA